MDIDDAVAATPNRAIELGLLKHRDLPFGLLGSPRNDINPDASTDLGIML
jgi:hypothetical protein